MIDARCECGVRYGAAEADVGKPSPPCPRCGRVMRPVSAEPLPDGAGAGDFDSRLVFVGGPDRAGEQVLLGGCCEIEIGKLPDRHLQLGGQKVSRLHCKLVRVDFGPSRWRLEDNHSTNGLFVNQQRVAGHELKDGDVIQVGEYALRYASDAARPAAATAPVKAIPVGGPACPCCEKSLFPGATICTDCGIYVATGRPIVTSRGIDEDRVDEVARAAIWLPSWVMLMGLVPVASEAFGTKQQRTTWWITGITIACSFLFFFAGCDPANARSPAYKNLLLWSGNRALTEPLVREELARIQQAEDRVKEFQDQVPDYELQRFHRKVATMRSRLEPLLDPRVGFRPYQFLTHAVLHGGFFHLAGNLLFLLVFGLRVNELIGNLWTAIVYPVLAVCAAAVDMWATRHGQFHATLGASGAIAGLAGMYFVLFPVQRVRMLFFLNLWLFTAFQVVTAGFWIRGFWLLLLWFGWSDLRPVLLGSKDHVAHWAHLGGFASGMVIALTLLLTRQVIARGDILSVALGRRAWWLVGKPNRFATVPQHPASREAPATASAALSSGASST